ncbi:MAG TPA: thioredoxin domain-containing protein [Planctomycetota bacterium]|nr:thioredoxin domain-containing protein [Planctomycetota bacterium]
MKQQLITGLLAVLGAGTAGHEAPAKPAELAASVGETTISMRDLEEAAAPRLVALRAQESEIKEKVLDDLIAKQALSIEAAQRKISVEKLLEAEVLEKQKKATPEEVGAAYEASRERYQGLSEADALKRVEAQMDAQRKLARRAEFVGELRKKYSVKIVLQTPRLTIPVRDAALKGNKSAPIQIVEFSDFQCPACSQALPTLRDIQKKYGDQVAMGFRHFPLGIHKDARNAALAAECALEAGKFWPMHEVLFKNQNDLSLDGLKSYAKELGLDESSFSDCLSSAKHASIVDGDLQDGSTYGVRGTPTLFVNGRMVTNRGREAISALIDRELARTAEAKAQ